MNPEDCDKGYRSEKRYLVSQILEFTSDLSKVQIRLFTKCYEKSNLAQYELDFGTDEKMLKEMKENTK